MELMEEERTYSEGPRKSTLGHNSQIHRDRFQMVVARLEGWPARAGMT